MNISKSEDLKPVLTRAALALRQQNPEKAASHEFKGLLIQEQQLPSSFKSSTDPQERRQNSRKDGNTPKETEFDMKKARHEVMNFAMSNQRVLKNKRKMELLKLIKLGAKPQKKACKNYKDLQKESKRVKELREERKKYHQLGKTQTGHANVKCRTKTTHNAQKHKRSAENLDRNYGVAQVKLKKS